MKLSAEIERVERKGHLQVTNLRLMAPKRHDPLLLSGCEMIVHGICNMILAHEFSSIHFSLSLRYKVTRLYSV